MSSNGTTFPFAIFQYLTIPGGGGLCMPVGSCRGQNCDLPRVLKIELKSVIEGYSSD